LREDLDASATMIEGLEEAGMALQPDVGPVPHRPPQAAPELLDRRDFGEHGPEPATRPA
jgi:hypothetical protein